MVRERIQEVFDFATSESPYNSANKGWINEDVYLQWGSLPEKPSVEGEELVNVSVSWAPISKFLTIIFLVISLATVIVFSSISLSSGDFQVLKDTKFLIAKDSEPELTNNSGILSQATNSEVVQEDLEIGQNQAFRDEKPLTLNRDALKTLPLDKKPLTAVDLFQSKRL